MSKYMTLYTCDGKQCPKKTPYCRKRSPKNWLCEHTTHIAHAVNGECKDPWNHPERFVQEYEKQIHTTFFTEREDYTGGKSNE